MTHTKDESDLNLKIESTVHNDWSSFSYKKQSNNHCLCNLPNQKSSKALTSFFFYNSTVVYKKMLRSHSAE